LTGNELKDALLSEEPVIYGDVEYKCVSGIVYRKDEDKISIQAELMDKNNNSVSIVDPHRLQKLQDIKRNFGGKLL
jgi:hypothetical protein